MLRKHNADGCCVSKLLFLDAVRRWEGMVTHAAAQRLAAKKKKSDWNFTCMSATAFVETKQTPPELCR
jgi:hypothetical protein